MKKILIIILISLNLFTNDFLNIPLKDYISIVSKTNNINIVLDKNIDNKISFLVSKNLSKDTYLEVLHILLDNKNLFLQKQKNFYIIKQKKIIDDKEKFFFSLKLNYADFEDIKNFLNIYDDSIKYQFVTTTKTLFVNSTKDDFINIKNNISKIDIIPQQLKLKITIIDTNLEKIKEFGVENKVELSNNDSNFFFNLLAYPFSVSSDIPNNKKNKFYSFLKLINENGSSEFLSSPILTLTDNKTLSFDVGTTIPFSKGSTTVDESNTKTTQSIDYKDVGLTISATPKIYNNDLVYIDLDLSMTNIVSNNNNLPITSKKSIKQSFYFDSKKIFVLTGINQSESIQNTSGIPLLMDIPYFGWLFKYDSKNQTNSNLSIFLEIVDNKQKINHIEHFKRIVINKNKLNHQKRVNQILGVKE